MFVDKIREMAESKKVFVFFDLDGTLAEYKVYKNNEHKTQTGLYSKLRKLQSTCKVVKKLTKLKNVEVSILSNCNLSSHEQEKLEWVKRHLPFVKDENVNILCFETLGLAEGEDCINAKRNYLENRFKDINCSVVLVDDDVRTIKSMLKSFVEVCHVSEIIK